MSDRFPSLGALWLSASSNPNAPFAKGSIELNGQKIPVVVWPNRYKQQDLLSDDSVQRERAHKAPDYRIERDQPRENTQQPAQQQRPPAVSAPRKSDDFNDDIPF